MKSGQFIHLSEQSTSDANNNIAWEINLNSFQTGWDIKLFASFAKGSEKYLKVIYLFIYIPLNF
jgi:hypothetical protein